MRTTSSYKHGADDSVQPKFGDAQLEDSSSEEEGAMNNMYMSLGAQYGMEFKLARQKQERESMSELLRRHNLNQSFGGEDHDGRNLEHYNLGPARHSMDGHELGARYDRVSNNSAFSTVRQSMIMAPVLQSHPKRDGEARLSGNNGAPEAFEGYLHKKGQRFKSWKLRYFQLMGKEIKYSVGPGGKIKGFGVLVGVDYLKDLPFGLTMRLAPNRTLDVYAESTDEQEAWYKRLQRAAMATEAPIEVPPTPFEPTAPPSSKASQSQVQSDLPPSSAKRVTSVASLPRVPSIASSTSSDRASRHSIGRSGLRMSQISSDTSDSETVEGYLFKQGRLVKSWKQRYFMLVNRTLSYRESPTATHLLGHGHVVSVERNNTSHAFGLAIGLDGNRTLYVYAENDTELRKWFKALSALALPIPSAQGETLFKQSRTHGAFLKNFSGWMSVPSGLFNASLKRCFFTLHGIELTQSDEAAAPLSRTDAIHHVVVWPGKTNGIEFHMRSTKVWKVICPSQSAAIAWLAAVNDNLKRQDFTVDRFLKRCVLKELPTLMCGWLTQVNAGRGRGVRQFFVLENLSLRIACDVDAVLQPYDTITRVGPSPVDCAFELHFASEPPLVLQADSVDGLRNWHMIVRTCLKEPIRQAYVNHM
ncbi:hypothetical protein ACHHYP_15017 [Achlya hypogyna]|uniref:PH domain-containing protein n=1 Tax=Achlya hypogyna TaxID=1202772 RepID=A0A1V9YBN0_ACHHY|nr:hypothetical protein ACHHYP_15017 [Achlya hypogyna]